MEKLWWCVECSRDPRCVTGNVRWSYRPLTESRLRVLCHLLTFHRLTFNELHSAEQVDGAHTGVLLIRPHRQLAAWADASVARDDTHRVGKWVSDVLRKDRVPVERPPY